MTRLINLSWDDVQALSSALAGRWAVHARGGDVRSVYGVPRGGHIPALLVAQHLQVPIVAAPEDGTLVVDDLVDSGRTALRYMGDGHLFDALCHKPATPTDLTFGPPFDGWLVFPWETGEQSGPEDAVVRLLEFIGEDPHRDGLLATPGRVLKAWREMTAGYQQDPAVILSTTFEVEHDQMIVVRGVPFVSTCEHHLMPFTGTATVAYIPNPEKARVVGLSKLARLVHCYARRLQVQERMTDQIAEAIKTHLDPLGVGVVIQAHHTCMSARGVQSAGDMVTARHLGVMFDKPEARAELLALHRGVA